MRRVLLPALLLLAGCSVPRWPVDGPVTSPFGLRRSGFTVDIHRGIDIAVGKGAPVRAMAPGTVVYAGTMSGYGNVVIIDHGRGWRSLYAHLAELSVRTDQELSTRAVVGLAGSTGRSSGPHLHFEVQHGGWAEDPVPLLGGFPDGG